MSVKELYKGLFHVKFNAQYTETSTFMRLQEFYESPFTAIRSKYFTREDYEDRYFKEYGLFDYYTKWSGFNVPGNTVNLFFRVFSEHNDLTKKETKLFKEVLKISSKKQDSYYLIATHDDADIDHEVAHGFYYLFPEYRESMTKLLKEFSNCSMMKKLRIKLLNCGYCKKFLDDEAQAYLSTDTIKYSFIPLSRHKSNKIIIKKFKATFKKFKRMQNEMVT